MEKYTADLLIKDLDIAQPESGYRFSMDPVLLASHIHPKPHERILDIGCGCGVMPLILARNHLNIHVIGVEIQRELSAFATTNIKKNNLAHQITLLNEDIREIFPADLGGAVDRIISNPPYKKANSGRINPDPQKAMARHDISLDLDTLFACSARLLKPKGTITIIFPAGRLQDISDRMGAHAFGLECLKSIHTRKDRPAKLVLVSGRKNGKQPCRILPPLIIQDPSGRHAKADS